MMRYLVRGRVKPGQGAALLAAIENGSLGLGSIAGAEYLRDMGRARLFGDGTARWIEICFCSTPLEEEKSYWEQYFDLTKVQDAHDRRRCKDKNGSEPWACMNCDCTAKLEEKLERTGKWFLQALRSTLETSKDPSKS